VPEEQKVNKSRFKRKITKADWGKYTDEIEKNTPKRFRNGGEEVAENHVKSAKKFFGKKKITHTPISVG